VGSVIFWIILGVQKSECMLQESQNTLVYVWDGSVTVKNSQLFRREEKGKRQASMQMRIRERQ